MRAPVKVTRPLGRANVAQAFGPANVAQAFRPANVAQAFRPAISEFRRRVLAAVRRIPPGRVATYGDIAAAAGRPRAARAVGTIMRDCAERDVPCHRVIAAAGRLGGYGGNEGLKRELLRAEGVLVSGTRVRDFQARRWGPRPRTAARRTT